MGLAPSLGDPEYETKLALYKERANQLAVSIGLPPVGSRMTNVHGIEWVVDGHAFASGVNTLGKAEGSEDPRDLYPLVLPQNLSPRLLRVLDQLHLCTPKGLVPLDTSPELRPEFAHPFGHSVDAFSDPCRVLFFLDVARIGEAAFAHEAGHVWIDLVDGIEDHRILKDATDVARYSQVQQIQSFVLDFAVTEFLRRRGFDLSEIEEDRRESLRQLEASVFAGYRPPTPWESVFLATFLAETLVENEASLVRSDRTLEKIRADLPEAWALAEDLADAVRRCPPASAQAAMSTIDCALTLCFAHAGEHLDLDADLAYSPPNVEWWDKWPEWLMGFTPMQKAEVGKAIARADLGLEAHVELQFHGGTALARFSEDERNWTEWTRLPFSLPEREASPLQLAKRKTIELNDRRWRTTQMQHPKIPYLAHGKRAYSTGMARWLTKVRMEEFLGGESPYGYADANPLRYVDPSGNEPCPPVVEKTRAQLMVQLMLLSWDKRNAERVSDCIKSVSAAGAVRCGSFTQGHAECLRDHFPLMECDYGHDPSCVDTYGRSPEMPKALHETSQGSVRHITLCLGGTTICKRGGTNFLPQLQRNQQQVFWATMLHEGLHNCAFHHGEDLNRKGYAPTADRTCNEIAVCCINRVISKTSPSACKATFPKFWQPKTGKNEPSLIGGL